MVSRAEVSWLCRQATRRDGILAAPLIRAFGALWSIESARAAVQRYLMDELYPMPAGTYLALHTRLVTIVIAYRHPGRVEGHMPHSRLPVRPQTLWGPVLGSPVSDRLGDRHEVLVVGAGIAGLSTALLLAERGVDVGVIDAQHPGLGTTGHSTAKVSLLQGTRTAAIRNHHGRESASAYLQANQVGQDLIRRVVHDTGIVDHEMREAWTFACTSQGEQAVVQEFDALTDLGFAAELRQSSELPFATRSAVCLPEQSQINPAQYLAALLGELAGLGVPVAWPHRAASISEARGQLRVSCTDGLAVSARWVILATLLPFPLRSLMFANNSAHRSYSVACRVKAELPHGMYLSADEPTVSLRTAKSASGEQLLLAGGHGHPTGKDAPARRHLVSLADWTERTFSVREFTHWWSAQDYTSVDGLPQIGPAPLGPAKVLLATGFGKGGFTNGSAAAHILSQTVLGQTPGWARPFLPRLASGSGGWRGLIAQSGRVGLDLARGWIVDPALGGPEQTDGGVVRRDLPHPEAVSRVDGVRRTCSAVCPHMGGIVRWNDAEKTWDCPLHGSRFAPDGQVVEGPARQGLAVDEPVAPIQPVL